MAMNKQRIAALLAEKAKNQSSPLMNNPLAKAPSMGMVNPLNIPMPMASTLPAAPRIPTPGFKQPSRFVNLVKKLGKI